MMMQIWSAEIKELESIFTSFRGRYPELEKELERLVKADDENMVLLYSRRCLEVIITDLCECELKRPRRTEPLKGIIDKLQREEKVPSHIVVSMQYLNSLSSFGAHPKEFDPREVKPVLLNLITIIEWYVKYKEIQTIRTEVPEEAKYESTEKVEIKATAPEFRKRLIFLFSGIFLAVVVIISALFIFNIIGDRKQTEEVEKSIAVLPFTSLSTDPEKQYLADGVMDAILLHLSKIEDLRVMSRTSVLQYRGTEKTTNVIGKELGVEYLLEGSFQKYGDNARLIVQLIKTGKEGHVWAKEYDRNWSDIFSVQSEVAQSIAGELNAVITPQEKELINKVPTRNLTAYDLHLQALEFYNTYLISRDKKLLEKVSQLAYISLDLDPDFALAYYWLGESSLGDRTLSGWDRPFFEDTALYFFNKALELDPTLSEAYSERGNYYFEKNQKQKALEDMKRAISLSPSNSVGYLGLGYLYFDKNDFINALVNFKKAEKLERAQSNLALIYSRLYMIYLTSGDFQKAELYVNKVKELNIIWPDMELWLLEIQGKWKELQAEAERDIELQPGEYFGYTYKADALLGLGSVSEAEDFMRRGLQIHGTDLNNAHRVALPLWMNGKKDEAIEYFNKQISYCTESINRKDPYGNSGAAYDMAGVYAVLGNKEEAYRWLNEYEKTGFGAGLHEFLKFDPLFDNLRNDEEFKEIVRRVNDKAAEIRAGIKEMEEKGEK